MRSTTPLLAASAVAGLAMLSTPAEAGGIGVLGTGGFRQVPAYFYDAERNQGIDWQSRPSYGLGIEGVLGDKDDRILGICRFYSLWDQPTLEPDLSDEEGDTSEYVFPPAHEQSAVTVGAATIGVQWGIFGDPTGLQFVASTMAGTAFLSSDSLEFFIFEPGVGVSWTTNDRIQVFGNANWQVRFRKNFSQGGNVVAGVRYLFD
jgi:hypothetical protein